MSKDKKKEQKKSYSSLQDWAKNQSAEPDKAHSEDNENSESLICSSPNTSKNSHVSQKDDAHKKQPQASSLQQSERAENKPKRNRPASNLAMEHVSKIPDHRCAKAPYNFVPLNKKVVEAEAIPGSDSLPMDRYHEQRHTGYIEVIIETQTPLYIRDSLNKEEMDKEAKCGQGMRFINPDFFSPANRIQIPGSSLRGMIRTMVEMVAFGKFGFCDRERRLYFRALADKCNGLRKEYQREMTSFDPRRHQSNYKMSAGVLKKEGFKYFILPSDKKQIDQADAEREVAKLGQQYREFSFYKLKSAYLVVSGKMEDKKHDWLVYFPVEHAKPISVSEQKIKDYKNDANRKEDCDLLKLLQKHPEGVPCFYVKNDEGDIACFGHTAMFRLAYSKTIGEHIPDNLQDTDVMDIAEAMFGNEKTFAGRVFFESAYLQDGQTDVLMETSIPKILSGPKPTTFQHYLTQRDVEIKELDHWNGDTAIRGNKCYWHQSGTQWEDISLVESLKQKILASMEIPKEIDSQHTKIRPIKPQVKFVGKIRFENLSDVELGALLFALDLPKGCAHKLGMGKPLGLGTVKITPQLHLSQRKQRYSSLFSEWDGIADCSTKIAEFKTLFEKHVIAERNFTSLWEIPRLSELRRMLDVQEGRTLENAGKIRYMQIEVDGTGENEFKNRPVLPKPKDV